jgi:hypothetical protein
MISCESTSWFCGWCNNGYEFQTYQRMNDHMTHNCRMKPCTRVPALKIKKKDFICNDCGNKFGTNKGLLRHKRENCKNIVSKKQKCTTTATTTNKQMKKQKISK